MSSESNEEKYLTTRLWRSVVERIDEVASALERRAVADGRGAKVSRSSVVEMALDALAREQTKARTK